MQLYIEIQGFIFHSAKDVTAKYTSTCHNPDAASYFCVVVWTGSLLLLVWGHLVHRAYAYLLLFSWGKVETLTGRTTTKERLKKGGRGV